MKKRISIPLLVAGGLLLAAIGSSSSDQSSKLNNTQINDAASVKTDTETKPVCDGKVVTTNCTVKGVAYKTYLYHPAVAEKTHTETVTTYKEEVTGYCTLCNDGTYSPSCATGRGACSHHGGVAQWNAPRYSKVPVYSTKTVVDAPAQKAHYEKVLE